MAGDSTVSTVTAIPRHDRLATLCTSLLRQAHARRDLTPFSVVRQLALSCEGLMKWLTVCRQHMLDRSGTVPAFSVVMSGWPDRFRASRGGAGWRRRGCGGVSDEQGRAGRVDVPGRVYGWPEGADSGADGDGGERLHAWMAGNGPDSDIDAGVRREVDATVGAAVIGRRTFDLGLRAWGGTPWPGVPSFVVTHRARQDLLGSNGGTFAFDGCTPLSGAPSRRR